MEEVEDEDDDQFDHHDVDSESKCDTDEIYGEDEDSDEADKDRLTEEDHMGNRNLLNSVCGVLYSSRSLYAKTHTPSGKVF